MGVDMPPPDGHFLLKFGDTVDNRHDASSGNPGGEFRV
jgi:hypothetical protein